MESSGKVDRDLIEALDRDGRARVIVVLKVRSESGALLRRFDSDSTRRDLRRRADGILSELPEGRFDLSHRYRSVGALAGEADVEGVLTLQAQPAVARVGLDHVNHWTLAEAVPVAGVQSVRRRGKHGKGVWVAVLDSGVDTDHRDLKAPLRAQECFCSPDCCPDGTARQSGKGSAEDDVGHGTLVAGVAVSRGKVAPRGAAMRAKLLMMKIGDEIGPKDADILAALDWLLTDRPAVEVITMSFSGDRTYKGNCDKKGASNRARAAAINALRDRGTVAFASSGNSGRPGRMGSPACLKNVISVGAVYDEDFGRVNWRSCTDETSGPNQLVCFTDRSKTLDLLAPGAEITGPGLGGNVVTGAGTSFSSPLAAGCAVLLKRRFPDATPDEVEAALESSSLRVSDPRDGRSYPALRCDDAFAFLAALAPG